jgi:hypothetical protein
VNHSAQMVRKSVASSEIEFSVSKETITTGVKWERNARSPYLLAEGRRNCEVKCYVVTVTCWPSEFLHPNVMRLFRLNKLQSP